MYSYSKSPICVYKIGDHIIRIDRLLHVTGMTFGMGFGVRLFYDGRAEPVDIVFADEKTGKGILILIENVMERWITGKERE